MKRSTPIVMAYVAFGSNRGRRLLSVERALRAIAQMPQVRLKRVSRLYETSPVGGPRQGPFLNGVAALSYAGSPRRLMTGLLAIETALGRRRAVRWGPRVIDLDLIACGSRRLRGRDLTLPHPRYHERRFVLIPLADVAPRFRHPTLGLTPRTLLRRLPPAGQRVTMVGEWKESRYRLFSKRKRRASASSR